MILVVMVTLTFLTCCSSHAGGWGWGGIWFPLHVMCVYTKSLSARDARKPFIQTLQSEWIHSYWQKSVRVSAARTRKPADSDASAIHHPAVRQSISYHERVRCLRSMAANFRPLFQQHLFFSVRLPEIILEILQVKKKRKEKVLHLTLMLP